MLSAEFVVLLIAALAGLLMFFLVSAVFLTFFPTWLQAYTSGVQVSLLELILMKLRKTDFKAVVQALIAAKRAGIHIACSDMEKAVARGADLEKIVSAMSRAQTDGVDVTMEELVEVDLENRRGEKGLEEEHVHQEQAACS